MRSKNNGQKPENKDAQQEAVKGKTSSEVEQSIEPTSSDETVTDPNLSEHIESAEDAEVVEQGDQQIPTSAKKPEKLNEESAERAEKQGKRGVKLATLAIVLTAIFGGGAAFVLNQQNMQHADQIALLEAKINSLSGQFEQRISSAEASAVNNANTAYNKAETAIKQQQESIQSLQVAISDIKGRRPNDWLLAESDYLVKLAGRKLFLEKDVVSATLLMESADQRISVLNDPSLVPLRKEMAKDITNLKSVALVDKEGLVLRLISLQQQVDKLPLANAVLPDAPVESKKVVSGDISDWQDNLLTSIKTFSEQFITFRTRDGNVIPLLAPEQHYYLKENIKGKIETAIRAVYNEQQDIYQNSLVAANEWAMQFFKQDDPSVKQFDKTMQQLKEQNIEVVYPVKLVSQTALADVISERLRRQVTSMTAEE